MTTPALYTPPTINFNAKALMNIRALVPKTATDEEFDRFIAMNQARGLDPRLGHSYLFIFNADKPDKRNVVTVVSEQGYLAAADRCRGPNGDHIFRPDSETPRYEYDESAKNPDVNPLGLVSAEVAVYKFMQGEWHRVPAKVFWDERAPLNEKWVYDREQGKKIPTGEYYLDKRKGEWTRQPRNMLAKCARIAAARYAFPDQLGGLYFAEEAAAIERGKIMTASETIEATIKDEQMKALGVEEAIMFDLNDGNGLSYIPLGMIHDRLEAKFQRSTPQEMADLVARNRVGVREFVALKKGEWVDLRRRYLDPAAEKLKAEEAKKEQEAVDNADGSGAGSSA